MNGIAIKPICLFYCSITRVIFYVRRIGLYLYKYRIHGNINIYILKGLVLVYHMIFTSLALSSVKIFSFE